MKSISSPRLALVEVNIKSKHRSDEIPEIWDELRCRVNEAEMSLPLGAFPPVVLDDFSDVFGILFAVTGKD